MTLARLALLGAISAVLCAQQRAQEPVKSQDPVKRHDLNGWDKVNWGMTMDQVRASYAADAKPESKDEWMLLQLQPVDVAGVEMGVQVGARLASGKVSSVRLWSYFGIPNSNPKASGEDFDTLRGFLIRQYGMPASDDTTRGENGRLVKTATWKFPSTTVVLTLEQSAPLPNLGKIFLEYTAAK